ncbi:MAG TPA: hypothetical protein VLR27_04040 [Acidimicrobiales bacterium]|nr:hypothetical protein [Acidimicrobiales bacterium]
MGQSVNVVAKHSSNPEILRFEINRSLTGMGHERYRSLDDLVLDRPVDRLARRLLEHGGVDGVHVNSSVITVDLGGGYVGDGLQQIIEDLFRFYPDAPDGNDAPEADEASTEVAAEDAPVAQEPLTGDETELREAPEAAAATGDGELDTPAEAPAEAPDPDRPDDEGPPAD